MTIVKCVNCGGDVKLDLSQAQDENGEVFKCPHCGLKFRYTEK